jgi:uncharacterized membrane protein YraQ (UPF0718 family)
MITFVNKNKITLLFTLIFAAFTIVSFVFDFRAGKTIFNEHLFSFFKEMILFLPVMFILIGLGDVWISKEKVEKHIGESSRMKGILFVILLSMAQAGPLYSAFPVTYLLWKKGASIRNIFIYIGAFCTIKIPMLTFEIGFLGWKFSLLRALITLPIIILIAIIMEKYLKNKKFEVRDV